MATVASENPVIVMMMIVMVMHDDNDFCVDGNPNDVDEANGDVDFASMSTFQFRKSLSLGLSLSVYLSFSAMKGDVAFLQKRDNSNKDQFLDASLHLYKRVCPSIRPSVCPLVHNAFSQTPAKRI